MVTTIQQHIRAPLKKIPSSVLLLFMVSLMFYKVCNNSNLYRLMGMRAAFYDNQIKNQYIQIVDLLS